MNIITKSLEDLKPAEYNPRVISEKELDNLKKSIHKFGYLELIVYNKRTDRIISGHQRLKALKELGQKEIEVIEVDLDEKDEKALNIAMNKISGDWDLPKLEVLLNDLKLEGMLDLTGFSELELKDLDKLVTKLENENLEAEEDDFDESEVSENKYNVKRGDIYLLGNHRLMCGDSTNKEDVDKLMNGKKADLVLTDPPYGINLVKNDKVGADFGITKKGKYKSIIGDNNTDITKKSYEIIKDVCDNIILFGGNYFIDFLPFSDGWLIWDKREDTGIRNTFADGEMAWCSFHTPVRIYRQLWNGVVRSGEHEKRVHPTQKPVQLLGNIIKDFSEENNIILDLFGGSGSTLIACEQLNRVCYGMELDEHYCSVIIERFIKLKGSEQVFKLEGDNKIPIGDCI